MFIMALSVVPLNKIYNGDLGRGIKQFWRTAAEFVMRLFRTVFYAYWKTCAVSSFGIICITLLWFRAEPPIIAHYLTTKYHNLLVGYDHITNNVLSTQTDSFWSSIMLYSDSYDEFIGYYTKSITCARSKPIDICSTYSYHELSKTTWLEIFKVYYSFHNVDTPTV